MTQWASMRPQVTGVLPNHYHIEIHIFLEERMKLMSPTTWKNTLTIRHHYPASLCIISLANRYGFLVSETVFSHRLLGEGWVVIQCGERQHAARALLGALQGWVLTWATHWRAMEHTYLPVNMYVKLHKQKKNEANELITVYPGLQQLCCKDWRNLPRHL